MQTAATRSKRAVIVKSDDKIMIIYSYIFTALIGRAALSPLRRHQASVLPDRGDQGVNKDSCGVPGSL